MVIGAEEEGGIVLLLCKERAQVPGIRAICLEAGESRRSALSLEVVEAGQDTFSRPSWIF